MKKQLLIACLGATALWSPAQDKLDIGGRARLRALSSPVRISVSADRKKIQSNKQAAEESPVIRAFITTSDAAATVSALEEYGIKPDRMRGNIVLAQFPSAMLKEVEGIGSILSIHAERELHQKLDKVRPAVGADKIHAGFELPQAYTGKGVVAGIVDGGFDPNHLNFRNPDGSSRIGQFTYFRAQQNSSDLIEQRFGPDYMPEIDTENDESFHATHTTGIMAGSYNGNLEAAIDQGNGTAPVSTVRNPYYGIAWQADIATASAYKGQLSDYYIAQGIESILDYAYMKKQPTVINLSLGNNSGPHDGTSPLCQYLDAIIEDDEVNAIVCMAAGNEGEMPIALSKTLTGEDVKAGTGIYPMYDGYIEGFKNPRQGQTYIYSDSEEPFEVQVQVINTERNNRVAKRLVLEAMPEGGSKYWVSEAAFQQDASDIIDQQFGKYFNGYVGIGAERDAFSGRYYSVVDMMLWDNLDDANSDSSYIIGIEVTGKAGQRIDFYGDGSLCSFSSYGVDGYSDGDFNGTISDIATGKHPIVVGSWNARESFPCMDGYVYGFEGRMAEGAMSPFTSFGTLIDGRSLPDVCAPGASVISSSNEYYLQLAESMGMPEPLSATAADEARLYSWHQCSGTSMACPVVAGSIALWLEAYPELTAREAKEIIRRTAVRDEFVASSGDPVQWGAGKFNAYEGLKEVLKLKADNGVGMLPSSGSRLDIVRTGARKFEIVLQGAVPSALGVFNSAGLKVADFRIQETATQIDLSHLLPGTYILASNGQAFKIILK